MTKIGVPFFSEYCKTCKVALDLPAHANGRCDLCNNKPVWKWVIYRHSGANIDLCTPEEVEELEKGDPS